MQIASAVSAGSLLVGRLTLDSMKRHFPQTRATAPHTNLFHRTPMSASTPPTKASRQITVPDFAAAKAKGEKLAVLTAYDFPTAQVLDQAGVDALLVGDSLAMVVQGHDSTLPVTLDQMIYHGEMVARAAQRALVIVDMPFGSYQVCAADAVRNAVRIIKETNAAAVKLEGGVKQAETIRAIVEAEVPVMGHVGLRPQAIRQLGRANKVQRAREQLLEDALAAEDAGAFAVVIELTAGEIAAEITKRLSIPTIGIGAGPACDGQVLVTPDVLGQTYGFEPRFLKRYASLHETVTEAVRGYVEDVKSGRFPTEKHTHTM